MNDFGDFLRSIGLRVERPIMDGRVHRCPTERKPRHKNGAYQFLGDHGWGQAWDTHLTPVIWSDRGEQIRFGREAPKVDMAARLEELKQKRAAAAQRAQAIFESCTPGTHPYLAAKGFPEEQGLLDPQGFLVVPMRRFLRYESIASVQWIDDVGDKKFLPGGSAKGVCFALGKFRDRLWLVEGLATGLSVRAALRAMYQPDTVLVGFSAGNVAHLSELIGDDHEVRIVADNDESSTGQHMAEQSGRPWVMPEEVGTDANDLHQSEGIHALTDMLRRVL